MTTTNGALSFSVVSQVVDGTLSPSYKWFSLQENKLDSSFHPIDSKGTSQIGWWGSSLSDANGNFSTYPTLTTDAISAIYSISITGDSLLNEYPVDFDIHILDANDAVIYTVGCSGNYNVTWEWHLDKVYSGKIQIVIKKVNKPNHSAKILEANQVFDVFRQDSGAITVTESDSLNISTLSQTGGTVSIAEAKVITVSDSSVDSVTFSVTESKTVTVNDSSTDIGTISTVDATTYVGNADYSSDICTVSCSESSTLMVSDSSSDYGSVSTTEISIKNETLISSDTGSIRSTDATLSINALLHSTDNTSISAVDIVTANTISDSSSDICTVSCSESSTLMVSDSSSDYGSVSAVDSSFFSSLEKWSNTTGTMSISEVSINNVSLYSSDTVSVSSTDTTFGINASLQSSDILTVSTIDDGLITTVNDVGYDSSTISSIEGTSSISVSDNSFDSCTMSHISTKVITVTDASTDVVTASLSELSNITISMSHAEAASVSEQSVSALTVTIMSSDAATLGCMDVVSAPHAGAIDPHYLSNTDQLVDNNHTPDNKWLFLDGTNILDGSVHPVDSTGAAEIGWIGSVLSDASCQFVTPQIITLHRGNNDVVNYFRVSGDRLLNVYPVDFDVELYDEYGSLIKTINITGNSNPDIAISLLNETPWRVDLVIHSINLPNALPRIMEMELPTYVESSQIITVSSVDDSSVVVNDASSDTCSVSVTELKTIVATINSGYITTVTGTEVSSLTNSLYSSDSGSVFQDVGVGINGKNVLSVSGALVDSGTISISESSAVTVNDSSIDSTTISATDTSFFSTLEIWKTDISAISVVEGKVITVSDNSSDDTSISVTESDSISVYVYTVDSTGISILENKTVTVSDNSTDTTAISILDVSSIIVSDTLLDSATVSSIASTSVNVSDVYSDTATVGLNETNSINVSAIIIDSCSISVLESSSIQASLSTSDQGSVVAVEASNIVANIYSNDVTTITATNGSNITSTDYSSDSCSVSHTSSVSLNVSDTLLEVVTVSIVETSNITVSFSSIDSGAVSAIDQSTPVVVSINKTDIGTASTVDTSWFVTFEVWRQDSAIVSEVDTKTVNATVSSVDNLNLTAKDKWDLLRNTLISSDAGTIAKDPEFVLTLAHGSVDLAVISVKEEVNMTNVHTKMDESLRQIYGKVEITYTDPFMDEDVVVIASDTAYGTNPQYTADTTEKSKYLWFSLAKNRLDGSYHPIPNKPDIGYSVGWWSNVVSGTDCKFTTKPVLTVTFDPRIIYDLKVVGDNLNNICPVDFHIKLYDTNGTQLFVSDVYGNSQIRYFQTLVTPITQVAKMELTIDSINIPNSVAKINEFFTAVVETYTDEELISIGLLEEQDYETNTLPIGNLSANQIEVRLDNTSRKFDPSNSESALYGLMKRNRRLRAWFGVEVIEGTIEWHQLGTFWSMSWDAPTWATFAEIIARDRLELLRNSDYATGVVAENASIYDLAKNILDDAGVDPSQYIIDTSLQNKFVPFAWFPIMSHRDALARVAAAGIARCYCNRDGLIVVEAYAPQSNSVYTFSNEDSILDSNHPVAWSQLANDIQVAYASRRWGPLGNVFSSEDAVTLQPGETKTEQFLTSDIVGYHTAPSVTMDAGVSVVSYSYRCWGMEITFKNNNSVASNISSVAFDAKPLLASNGRAVSVSDQLSIRLNGRQKFSMDHELIQDVNTASTIANSLLSSYKDARNDAVVDSRGNIALRLGDRVQIPGRNDELSDYSVIRQDIYWEGYLKATVEAQKI